MQHLHSGNRPSCFDSLKNRATYDDSTLSETDYQPNGHAKTQVIATSCLPQTPNSFQRMFLLYCNLRGCIVDRELAVKMMLCLNFGWEQNRIPFPFLERPPSPVCGATNHLRQRPTKSSIRVDHYLCGWDLYRIADLPISILLLGSRCSHDHYCCRSYRYWHCCYYSQKEQDRQFLCLWGFLVMPLKLSPRKMDSLTAPGERQRQ